MRQQFTRLEKYRVLQGSIVIAKSLWKFLVNVALKNISMNKVSLPFEIEYNKDRYNKSFFFVALIHHQSLSISLQNAEP